MSTKHIEQELAIVKLDAREFTVLTTPIADMKEALIANGIDAAAGRRSAWIRVPTGGGTSFTIPDLEGDRQEAELITIIAGWQDTRSYHAQPLDEGGTSIPDCYPADAVTGIASPGGVGPGGSSRTCKLVQFGSGTGRSPACKLARLLDIILGDELLPRVLKLPGTSIAPITTYFDRLSRKGLSHFSVVTTIGLERVRNAAGMPYSRATFRYTGRLTPDQTNTMRQYAQMLRLLRVAPVDSEPEQAKEPSGPIAANATVGEVH